MQNILTNNKYQIDQAVDDLVSGRLPDERGRYGEFGGRFVPEVLMPSIQRLEKHAVGTLKSQAFQDEFRSELRDFVGRPTALSPARRLSREWGASIVLKREDLAHTGAHKINNAIGQALLARHMGATRVIAETGAGQHGVATAAACARLGLDCTVYMGARDVGRQASNVLRMRQLGARVQVVESGDKTLRAAIDEAMRDWVAHPEESYYLLGSAVGPHPYPLIVREFQRVIGEEAREQILRLMGRLPSHVVACVGGGSNAIGLFHPFLADRGVDLIGVEAGGAAQGHAHTLKTGRPGVLHGSLSFILQDAHGQIENSHSVSAGLDYPGVGPEHAFLASVGRAQYTSANDDEAISALRALCALEGILPALESAHALAGAKRIAERCPDAVILVGLSGRGDKDLETLAGLSGGGAQ